MPLHRRRRATTDLGWLGHSEISRKGFLSYSGATLLALVGLGGDSAAGTSLTTPGAVANEALPALTDAAIQYVTTGGNDANTGLTWAAAKASIQAAVNALPLAADGTSRNGTVEIGYGTFTVSSSSWKDSVALQKDSTTVSDVGANDSYIGARIVGSHISPNSVVVSRTSGGFVMSEPALKTTTTSATFHRPGVALQPGIHLRGRGRTNGYRSGNSTNHPTLIEDNGSGITILAPSGTGPGNVYPTNASASRCVIEDLAAHGNPKNLYGLYAINLWGLTVRGCDFSHHGQWGIYLDKNSAVAGIIEDTICYFNGTTNENISTGGISFDANPNIFSVINCRFIKNRGLGARLGPGLVFIGCEHSDSIVTQYDGSPTGVGMYLAAGSTSGNVSLYNCWFQGNPTNDIVLDGSTPLIIDGSTFQGQQSVAYAIRINHGEPLSLRGCTFFNHTSGSIDSSNSTRPSPIFWENCYCADPIFYSPAAGSPTTMQPAAAARGRGVIDSTSITQATTATSVTLRSGSSWHNTSGSDVLVAIPIVHSGPRDGSAQIAIGSIPPGITLGTVTDQTQHNSNLLQYHVPAGWYLTVTLTNAVFAADATAQPV